MEVFKSKPKISVIIPIYNMQEYIQDCIKSAASQSLKNIEIICVDNNSTDSSAAIIEIFAQNDARIKIIKEKNQGSGPARNMGIKEASGEFIAFLDADDYYPNEDVLEKLYNKALENNVQICGGISNTDEKNLVAKVSWLAQETIDRTFVNKIANYQDYQFPYGYQNYIYSREFILKNNLLFPPLLRFQDPIWFIKTMNLAQKFYATEKVVYIWRKKSVSFNVNNKTVQDYIEGVFLSLEYCDKNHLYKCSEILFEDFLNRIIDMKFYKYPGILKKGIKKIIPVMNFEEIKKNNPKIIKKSSYLKIFKYIFIELTIKKSLFYKFYKKAKNNIKKQTSSLF